MAARSPRSSIAAGGGEHGDVGPGLGRDGGGLYRPRLGPSQPDHLRHGRHLDRCRPDRGRRAAGLGRARARIRHADPCADGRRAHDRRRRRLDRLGRCGRHAAGRAGERRRAAGADLLRPRRHRAHHHRRQPDPGPAQSRPAAGRRPSGDARPCARADRGEGRQAARPRRRCGGRRHPAHRQRPHGRRHAAGVAVARPRSARLRAVRLRRRGAAACHGAGARARRSRPCWCRRGPASPTRWAASWPTCATTMCAR